MMFV